MIKSLNFLSYFFISLFITKVSAQDISNYGDISIQAENVTLNESTNQLLMREKLKINFGTFSLSGDSAVLSYDEKKLIIDGSPAAIFSEEESINGTARQLIIYPNLAIEMHGNAQLVQGDRSIYSEQITYQINSND